MRTSEVSEESEGSDLEGKKRKERKKKKAYLSPLPAGLVMAFIAGKSPVVTSVPGEIKNQKFWVGLPLQSFVPPWYPTCSGPLVPTSLWHCYDSSWLENSP